MAERSSEKRVPFITVTWPDGDLSASEQLRGIFHSAHDKTAQFERLGTQSASGESAFSDFSCDDFAEALLDYQMQAVWDEIEAAEAANADTPQTTPRRDPMKS